MFTLIERELAAGQVAGSDFGSQVRVVARSPSHVLFNALGVQLWNRDERGGWHSLRSLTRERATIAVYQGLREKLDEVFGAGATDQIVTAWRTNRTVLVDDGGAAMPLPRRIRVCGDTCAAKYGRRAAKAFEPLPVGVEPIKQTYVHQPTVDHYEKQVRIMRLNDGREFKL